MGIPDHLICLLRNLYAGQEATELDMKQKDWFKIGKGVCQGCILSPCLFNLYGVYTTRNARLDEAQAGIKIVGRNINNLRYADDTTLMSESEENLKSFLINVQEESEKADLKLNIQKTKITTSGPITCCPNNSPGASDENEDRTRNLVPWVRGPAASTGLRCIVHSESGYCSQLQTTRLSQILSFSRHMPC